MNFLAHLHLSGNDPKIMVGNFIGDFVKGKKHLQEFECEIVRGIELHRAIDAFTDHHPVVAQSKNRLRSTYRHYAGVIVDVFYDHYLAHNWNTYHPESLADFASNAYQTINEYHSILPLMVQQFLPYMMKTNWLVNYSNVEGIARTLTGMAKRTPYISKMEVAVNDLKLCYADFGNEFALFYPDLIGYVNAYRLSVIR